jgi:AcrR family transcriptional regulator
MSVVSKRTRSGARPPLAPASTRERLLAAARELTEQGGYAAASVLAITQQAGLAAGTLYRHFPSKAELFVELFRSVCEREMQVSQRAAARSVDGTVERMEIVLETFAERALRNPRLAWALIAEPVDPLVDAERLAYRAHYARLLATGLRAAIAAGEVPEQNAELTAAALVGGVGEALVGPLSPLAGHPPSSEEITAALRVFVRRAVGAGA